MPGLNTCFDVDRITNHEEMVLEHITRGHTSHLFAIEGGNQAQSEGDSTPRASAFVSEIEHATVPPTPEHP